MKTLKAGNKNDPSSLIPKEEWTILNTIKMNGPAPMQSLPFPCLHQGRQIPENYRDVRKASRNPGGQMKSERKRRAWVFIPLPSPPSLPCASLQQKLFSLWLQCLLSHAPSPPSMGSVPVCLDHCDSSSQCFTQAPALITQPPPIFPPALGRGVTSFRFSNFIFSPSPLFSHPSQCLHN